jgi:hypothetical protein
MRIIKIVTVAFIALFITVAATHADLIDFEGFHDGQRIDFGINTPTNMVYIGVGPSVKKLSDPYIAKRGRPTSAFVRRDRPEDFLISGKKFLTDEPYRPFGPDIGLDYFFKFELPVNNLSLDLYDYRVDGGPHFGDRAILKAFSSTMDLLGKDKFKIKRPNPVNGNIESLSIPDPSGPIQYARLHFTMADVGTAIDNVRFHTVPEPSTFILIGLGLIGLGGFGKKRIKKKLISMSQD